MGNAELDCGLAFVISGLAYVALHSIKNLLCFQWSFLPVLITYFFCSRHLARVSQRLGPTLLCLHITIRQTVNVCHESGVNLNVSNTTDFSARASVADRNSISQVWVDLWRR